MMRSQFVGSVFLIVFGYAGIASGQVVWHEDFEDVPCGGVPVGWQTGCGNDDFGVDCATSCEGDRSLRAFGDIGGCRAALVARPIHPAGIYLEQFAVEFTVQNGVEGLSGCHPYRATLEMQTGQCWTSEGRTLVTILDDGSVAGTDWAILGMLDLDSCHVLRVEYERIAVDVIQTQYYLDGCFLGSIVARSAPDEDELTWFHWGAQEGTAWFDDITLTAEGLVLAVFEPPVANPRFVPHDGSTIPIKFHLVGADGTVIVDTGDVRLEVTGPGVSGMPVTYTFDLADGSLRFDALADPAHYIANFSTRRYPVVSEAEYAATVYENGVAVAYTLFVVDSKSGLRSW